MSSAALLVRKAARANLSFIRHIWRLISSFFIRLFTGKSELELLLGASNNDEMEQIVRFRTFISLSSASKDVSTLVFHFDAFDVEEAWESVVQTEKLNSNDIVVASNLRRCLIRYNYVNHVYKEFLSLKDVPYDSKNAKHEEMLEQLWSNLKPDIRRTGGRITKEWSEIGFQGTDPMTDFRGLGILSLHELIYFTSKYPVESKRALVDSNHPTRWYPFSVCGINITGFVVDLIRERLIDFKLYEYADVTNADSASKNLDQGVEAVHEFYCEIFTRFNALWVASEVQDLMAFPMVFKSLKETVQAQLMEKSFKY